MRFTAILKHPDGDVIVKPCKDIASAVSLAFNHRKNGGCTTEIDIGDVYRYYPDSLIDRYKSWNAVKEHVIEQMFNGLFETCEVRRK